MDWLELEKRIKALEDKECCNKRSKITTATDFNLKISGGSEVDMIKVKSNSILAALTIGTTPGGTDVLTSTATVVGWNTFVVNAFSEDDYKLYFGGITSASTIIIYKR